MAKLIIHHQGKVIETEAETGKTLLDVLRDKGFYVYAPCGGKGTCDKCKILIKGEGIISACSYLINDSIELI